LEGKVIPLGFARCHFLFIGFGASLDRDCVIPQYVSSSVLC